MTQEEKELLIKDISARLPYHPIIHIHDIDVIDYDNYLYPDYLEKMMSNSITLKPYLRPMSSMTKEEKIDYDRLCSYCTEQDTVDYNITTLDKTQLIYAIDWLNKNHFDYRGLIEKGLAIDETGLNIY